MDRIVVIGASLGGVRALQAIAADLPAGFSAPILMVVHIGASPSILPSILNNAGRLPAAHAVDNERLHPGRIYVAPPDLHMRVSDSRVELSRGPRENWTRPAIDPLFRTAAEAYGQGVIGVVLTGHLNDGTSGLWEIKRRGGLAIVQDPGGAEAPDMPRSALDNVAVDYCAPLNEIPGLLARLVDERIAPVDTGVTFMPEKEQTPAADTPAAQTCPECGGAMTQETQGTITRFRCHIGHAMTAEVLAAAQAEQLERDLAMVQRTLNERSALCREMADKHAARGDEAGQAQWLRAAEQAERRELAVRDLLDAAWRHPESAGGE